jgi:hypothetical protein
MRTDVPADWMDTFLRHNGQVHCRCGEVTELWDAEAKRYADEHLTQQEVRADGWEVLYACAATGARWLEDWPRSAEHGGGPCRLRRVDPAVSAAASGGSPSSPA